MASVSFPEHRKGLRHHQGHPRHLASTSATASSWCSSARRAAASRRCCACWPGSRRSPAARSRSTAGSVNDVDSKDRDIAMVFQSYALYPHMTVRDNMGFSLRLRKAERERDRRARRARGEDPEPRPVPRALSARAVGRPAPARRDGARDRPRSQGVPVRRAVVESRRQAARADARRDQGAAPAAEDHDRVRHARPDRGDDDGRSHRRHARRRDRADRHAARALRPAGQPVRRAVHRLARDEHRAGHAAPHERRRARRNGGRDPVAARQPPRAPTARR